MTGKSQKMVDIESDIASTERQIDSLFDRIREVRSYRPTTENGRAKQGETIVRLAAEVQDLQKNICQLREDLEIFTIDYLSGVDPEVTEGQMPVPEQSVEPAS